MLFLCSPFHELRGVALCKREPGAEVLLHHIISNVLEETRVDLFLQLLSLVGALGRGRLLLKEFVVGSTLLGCIFLESFIIDLIGINTLEIDLGTG